MNCKRLTLCAFALLLTSALGCPSDDDTGGNETEGEETGSTSNVSSSASVTLSSTSATTQTSASSGSSTSDTTSDDTSTTEPSTSGDTESTGPAETTGSTGTTGGPDAGVCVQGCEEDADCCPLGAIGCPSEDYPNNYTCNEGICEFGGCSDNAECDTLISDDECHPVGGVGTCFAPCEDDGDCIVGECVGMADDGAMFCATETPPCEDDDDCTGLGLCNTDDGTCYCDSSKNCTDMTLDTCSTDP